MTPLDARRARRIDEVAAAAVAASDEAHVDGWWCRANPSAPFRRANAALPPVGTSPGPELDAAIDRVVDWYRSRGLAVRVQISTGDPAWAGLDEVLAGRGLVVEAPVVVMVAPSTSIAGPPVRTRFDGAGVSIEARGGIDEAWVAEVASLHGADAAATRRLRAYGRILTTVGPGALGVAVRVDGRPVAIGFGVCDGPWCGIFGMATASDARRRGAAAAVLRDLAVLATRRGASDLYLQVEDDNDEAAALYRGVGFTPSHQYHYRTLPQP